MLECKNCCYFAATKDVAYEHCCFNEWGHGEDEVAPCDEPAYYEDGYEYNMPCDTTGICSGISCSRYFNCQGGR